MRKKLKYRPAHFEKNYIRSGTWNEHIFVVDLDIYTYFFVLDGYIYLSFFIERHFFLVDTVVPRKHLYLFKVNNRNAIKRCDLMNVVQVSLLSTLNMFHSFF